MVMRCEIAQSLQLDDGIEGSAYQSLPHATSYLMEPVFLLGNAEAGYNPPYDTEENQWKSSLHR